MNTLALCYSIRLEVRMKKLDLLGKVFSRLTVIREVGKSTQGLYLWECQCSCGSLTVVRSSPLSRGVTKSCGCLNREAIHDSLTTHGCSPQGHQTPEYTAWLNMRVRCTRIDLKNYGDYGGRGITVCPEWMYSFGQFYHDMGSRPTASHTLDRIDNDGPYCKSNCRWATMKEQANTRRNSILLAINGEEKNLAEWAELYNLHVKTLYKRLRNGWPIDESILKPSSKGPKAPTKVTTKE